jgi:hypothetical protein
VKGADANDRVKHGDVIKLRAPEDVIWPEDERGWVWARVVVDRNDQILIDIVAAPAILLEPIQRDWCNPGTWLSDIESADEVVILHPDKVPNKFWGYLAYRELTGNAQAI